MCFENRIFTCITPSSWVPPVASAPLPPSEADSSGSGRRGGGGGDGTTSGKSTLWKRNKIRVQIHSFFLLLFIVVPTTHLPKPPQEWPVLSFADNLFSRAHTWKGGKGMYNVVREMDCFLPSFLLSEAQEKEVRRREGSCFLFFHARMSPQVLKWDILDIMWGRATTYIWYNSDFPNKSSLLDCANFFLKKITIVQTSGEFLTGTIWDNSSDPPPRHLLSSYFFCQEKKKRKWVKKREMKVLSWIFPRGQKKGNSYSCPWSCVFPLPWPECLAKAPSRKDNTKRRCRTRKKSFVAISRKKRKYTELSLRPQVLCICCIAGQKRNVVT